MTVTAGSKSDVDKTDLVTLTIDGIEVSVPKGTLVIRAAETVGIQIPRFCDHPLLAPVGACRQCLVEVALPGPDGEPRTMMGPPGRVKPQASCTMTVSEGMVVNTQLSSPIADKAQHGVMEQLLINHPLDCPVCDKGGECPLQNQAMTNGRGETRFVEVKRTFPKPINISAQVLLDRERCVLCARCTRFSEQIAGDPFIALIERGALQQVGIYEQEPYRSNFSGNVIQICPVGALTSAQYRFRARPFDLVSTPSVAEHDSCGSAIRVDHRRGKVVRRLSGNDPEVNEEWISDKDRFAFGYATATDRLTHPQVRDEETGELRPASWPEAFAVAARGLAHARRNGGVGVLTGGRLTREDAYAYAKFARVALETNDVDFRSRPLSAEETQFLGAHVAGTGLGVTYADLERAGAVLLLGLEPEEEAGSLFLRLRKAVRAGGPRVFAVAPHTSRGLAKLSATVVRTAPGEEPAAIERLGHDGELALDAGGVILVGERLASVPGALSAVSVLLAQTGARLAWVPRRAGDRGALDAGALPTLLPGGRPVGDASARVDVGTVWGTTVPSAPGRDTDAILAAAASGDLAGLVVAGVELDDLADPAAARAAVEAAGFVVSLELRESAVTALADVVLPVAPPAEKAGSFTSWEGRVRPFGKVLTTSNAIPDVRALAGIADELGAHLGFRTPEGAAAELDELGAWDGGRAEAPSVAPEPVAEPAETTLVLATWKSMIGDGPMQDGDEFYKASGPPTVVLVSRATADRLGLVEGGSVELGGPRGSVVLPAEVADLDDHVVWAPTAAGGVHLRRDLGVASGGSVTLSLAEATLEGVR
ncbi:NADH-quinone oxidoreductase subunit G [Nocardioides marmoribigeumensis]|uniref:NADH-quinone oxidoreductase n=1 Tax=Nocardioides marmoribigeumensis TaxID=433649 RepID=A0ABU2BSS2_9ACTN|nr:NADH-quinone oxidoreductase subunit G [Nocardioides marmoribigeumensis]MDR7361683.1 NADH-quinone oxidoreductase subunit G [Nocardioides marmoribigeumensis]